MRILSILIVAVLSLGCETGAATAADSGEDARMDEFSMAQYEWRHRPLVVFATDDSRYEDLRKRIDGTWAEFIERNMVLIWVRGDEVVVRNSSEKKTFGMPAAKNLRGSFEPGDHRVFLVGKDGGIKSRSGPEVGLESIFELIDSMPMRQREMREREE